ncbi:hypothetical protein E1A91_D08G081500v1 [Gossypium mustelinum]|uniref:Uncharacterized protein n=2 Tax=Gossypium TaxID=3633 RepID=A0A5J5QD64_GOSBA|nr:hypothetical protein ES319_D08G079200v1 [Gossypium barbadense]TYI68332.1 hypothetical protein E1A91_D08G081500v1 [Gossypium mustelinum]
MPGNYQVSDPQSMQEPANMNMQLTSLLIIIHVLCYAFVICCFHAIISTGEPLLWFLLLLLLLLRLHLCHMTDNFSFTYKATPQFLPLKLELYLY